MKINECFAYRKGKCKVLRVKECPGSDCSFFKTEEQFQQDRQQALDRIRTLDYTVRINIIDTYYAGKDVLEIE